MESGYGGENYTGGPWEWRTQADYKEWNLITELIY